MILLIVLAVLVVAAAIWFFFLRGGGHEGSGSKGVKQNPKTPKFDFTVGALKAIGTTAGGAKKGSDAAANSSGKEIADELSRMYSLDFLDPTDWKSGNYGDAYVFFADGKTRDTAEAQGTTLTLGKNAGSLYSDVQPKSRTTPLDLKILLDENGKPRLAAADLKFTAIATKKSGGAVAVVSKGHFILRPAADGWEIYSFNVRRADHKGKASKPAKSPKAKATG